MQTKCSIVLSIALLAYSGIATAIEPNIKWGAITNKANEALVLQRKIWNQQAQGSNEARTLREILPSPSAQPQRIDIPIRWDNSEGQFFADFIIQNKNKPQELMDIMFTYDAGKDVLKHSIIKNKQLVAQGVFENASKKPAEVNLVINGPQLRTPTIQIVPIEEKKKEEPRAKPAAAEQKLPEPEDDRPVAHPDIYKRLNVPVYGTPAQILGVAPNATEQEYQKAFRKLSVQYHPDRNPEGAVPFKLISWAYEKMKHGDRPTVAHFAYEALGVPLNADAHQILGVPANATDLQVGQAYINLTKKWPYIQTDARSIGVNQLLSWAYESLMKKNK